MNRNRSLSKFDKGYTIRRWNLGRISITRTTWGPKRWVSITTELLKSRWP